MLPLPQSRILVIDDKPRLAYSLRELLSDIGEVLISTTSYTALPIIREVKPDLILLDIEMPGIDGFELCSAIKKEDAFKDIPIIFITGIHDRDAEVRAFGAHGVDFITKPFSIPVIRARIKTHLALKHRNEELLLNIAARKAAEERERRLKNIYCALSEINEAVTLQLEETVLFSLACRLVVALDDMQLAWIGIPDATGRFIPTASEGKAKGYLDELRVASTSVLPEGRGHVGSAFRNMRPGIANDVNKDEKSLPWRERNLQFGINSIAAFPLLRQGKSYAVLVVYSNLVHAFDEEIVSLLEKMADNISFALNVLDQESKRKEALQALERSEARLRLAQKVGRIGIFDWNIQTNSCVWSPTLEALHELPTGSFGGTYEAWMSLIHYQDRAVVRQGIKQALSMGLFDSEWRVVGSDGKVRWLAGRGRVFKDESGRPLRLVGIKMDITEKKISDEVIWTQANFDALTGLPNRRLFRDRLQQEVRNAKRSNLPLVLMLLDLDGFKDVNDAMGHEMGDLLLQEAARRLQASVREADTVSRLGGDEFTVILTELHDTDNIDRIACHILQALSEPIQLGEELAYVSASIGITLFPSDAAEVEDLIRNADQAMYAAKQEGKNRYQFFTRDMHEHAVRRMRIINDMRDALTSNQFEIVYQPIIELSTGVIQKAEALIRWQHPQKGLLTPIDFISAAENSGMITSFGNWIFHEASKQAAAWRERYHPLFQISINISPVQFKNAGIDPSVWLDHLRSLGLPGQGIVVEITESVLLDANSKVTDQLLMLRDAGIEVSLDDFGTGYSSLSYLKKFDIDYIKIDKSFVHNLHQGSDDMILCEAMIVMAHKLGIKVVAEGIETHSQHELLANSNCDFGQGYLFSIPVPADAFEELLQTDPFSNQELLNL